MTADPSETRDAANVVTDSNTDRNVESIPVLQVETVERVRSVTARDLGVAVLCPLALFLVAGVPGGVLGVFGVSVWLFAPVNAFVITQLGVLALVPAWPGVPTALGLESGIAALLLAEVLREQADWRAGGVFVLLAVVLGGGTVVSLEAGVESWVVALVGVGTIGLTCYGLHRYELLALGLISEPKS
ncbi:hypothetical protein [Halorientalis sp.]|uniref:hypothetical protein n=1 Tax=Halorientalis sp. TaxID=1931229 RepID=UPI00262F7885|nr:hypothetical protein [Halorientalis sp.]